MKILFYTWEAEYTFSDIVRSFEELGHTLSFYKFPIMGKNKENNKELYDISYKKINKDLYDLVFSINYFPDIARVCYEKNIIYFSWTYDCPLDIQNIEETLVYPTNRAFFFDLNQVEYFKSLGITTAFHSPLGISSKRLSTIKYSSSFAADISFIGQIYNSSFFSICSYLNDYYSGYLRAIKETQTHIYGMNVAESCIDDSIIEELNTLLLTNNCPYISKENPLRKSQLSYSITTEATHSNRLLIMSLLSNHFSLKWYTNDKNSELENAIKCKGVDYISEMPIVFKSSKINLHIGHHAITSGISLRQLDILGAGGFLLSSFQPELFDYFIPEQDFDFFSCPEEAFDKSDFYLRNDTLRSKIAHSGQEKAFSLFDYNIRIAEMLNRIT